MNWSPVRRVCRAKNAALAALLVAGSAGGVGQEIVERQGPSSAQSVEQLKRFIASPPVIKNLVWQQKVPMDGGTRPLDGSFARSTRFDYFQARWQTNGLLFRRLSLPEDANNCNVAGTLISIAEHQCALGEPAGRLTMWDDRDPSTMGKTVSVFYTSQFMREPLRRLMNLGIMYAGIGTVEWDGDRFRTECDVDHEHLVITGNLLASPAGQCLGLTAHYAFPHQIYDYVIRYQYAPALKQPILPSVITSFWVRKDRKGAGTEIEVDQYRILELETAKAPLAADAFDIAPFTQSNRWFSYVYTNGAFYNRGTNGALQFAYSLDRPMYKFRSGPKVSRAILYAGWGSLNLAIFALMLGAKAVKNQEN